MPEIMLLADAIEGVLDGIISLLSAQKTPTGRLPGVSQIVRGDRARPNPIIPAIWVYPDAMTPSNANVTLQEQWVMPILLVSVIKNANPELGYKEATSLAATARSIILKDRTLGSRPYVQDTESGRFEPSGPWYRDGQLFSAVAVVEVTFRILEF